MHFAKLATLLTLACTAACASIKPRDADIRVKFSKWATETCEGEGAEHDVDDDCTDMDHAFLSYSVVPNVPWYATNVDDDLEDPTCSVVVYEQAGCSGQSYASGDFIDALDMGCVSLPFAAMSVKTVCNEFLPVGMVDDVLINDPEAR